MPRERRVDFVANLRAAHVDRFRLVRLHVLRLPLRRGASVRIEFSDEEKASILREAVDDHYSDGFQAKAEWPWVRVFRGSGPSIEYKAFQVELAWEAAKTFHEFLGAVEHRINEIRAEFKRAAELRAWQAEHPDGVGRVGSWSWRHPAKKRYSPSDLELTAATRLLLTARAIGREMSHMFTTMVYQ